MKRAAKLLLCLAMIILPALSGRAYDFGLILDQDGALCGTGKNTVFDYTGILIPRFSALIGDNGGIYVSAGVNLQNNPWAVVPELLRTDFYWRFDSGEFRAGRMFYSDPLGYIAQGLFDGARISLDTGAGTFSAGAWYTGLLYKKRVNIAMTDKEMISLSETLKYSDFFNTYFAPRRVIAALDWEHPGLAEIVRVNVSLLGQFDLSGADYLHTQYCTAKISLPVADFVFALGGSAELSEVSGENTKIAFAGDMSTSWLLPTPLEDQLSLLGRFSSGVIENSSVTAFRPITTIDQGDVLRTKLSGLSLVSLNYLARICRPFAFNIASTYFIRSDLGTNQLFGTDGGYFLGNEFSGTVLWSPISDMRLNLGGGVFLPSLGNAAPKSDMLWRVELNLIISLY